MADSDPFEGHRRENGTFAPGNPGGPGRPKGPLFMKVLEAQSLEAPSPLHVKMAARGLGIEEDEVPAFETVRELRAWVLELAGLGGNDTARNAVLDREAPKPSRATVDVNLNGRAPIGAMGDSAEADDYMSRLEGDPSGEE